MDVSQLADSKMYAEYQRKAFQERFSTVDAIRINDCILSDAIHGIDAKADLITGETLNIQFKHRPKRTDNYKDVPIPIKKIMLKDLKTSFCEFIDDKNNSIPFILNLKKTDYFVVSAGDDVPAIFNATDLHRAFLYKKVFTHKECRMYDPESFIDVSERVLYIPQKLLFSIILTDWLCVTCGKEFTDAIKNNKISLDDYVF